MNVFKNGLLVVKLIVGCVVDCRPHFVWPTSWMGGLPKDPLRHWRKLGFPFSCLQKQAFDAFE